MKPSRCFSAAMIAVGFSALLVHSVVSADDLSGVRPAGKGANSAGSAIERHLAAGEFGAALAAADKLPRTEKPKALAKIAVAQHAAGAKKGASDTLISMSDDSARSQAADSIRRYGNPSSAFGGGVTEQDFEQLINLITNTIAPDTWAEGDVGGGEGQIRPFPAGVLVDPTGMMQRSKLEPGERIIALRKGAIAPAEAQGVNRPSQLRKVSLPRLERAVQWYYAQGLPPDETMLSLAGLQRVKYVFLYPESGEIVLAGPAGAWEMNAERRLVSVEGSQPVLRLDDLVTVLRNAAKERTFGCSIDPTAEGLAKVQAFLTESGKRSLPPGAAARDRWVAKIRESLGPQEITIHGIDPASMTARTIVEADDHMKRIGIGLEPGVLGVTNYLDLVKQRGGEVKSLDVLRWWFTLGDGFLRATPERNAFEFRGCSVRVSSHNELLTRNGERSQAAEADELNTAFAASFTRHFEALAAKYPVYGELRNVFDLAAVAALLRQEQAHSSCNWEASHFLRTDRYRLASAVPPAKTDSIAGYRMVNQTKIVAAVSGGVEVDARRMVSSDRLKTDDYGDLAAGKKQSTRPDRRPAAWWWD